MKLDINGVQLDFNLFDVDTLELYETANFKVLETSEKKYEKMSESLREQCQAVRNFFDEIFGEGVGIEVCGEPLDFKKHLDAFEIVTDSALAQRAEMDVRVKESVTKYKGNRAARRSK